MEEIYGMNPTINIELAKNNNFIINNSLSEDYIKLQKKYYIVLENYLIQKLQLLQAEQYLETNNRYLKKQLDSNNSASQLKYFFIRSSLNIEVLNQSDLNILRGESRLDVLMQLVERTLSSVIKVNYYNGEEVMPGLMLYDGTSKEYLKGTDSLILGLDYDIYDVEITDDEWDSYFIGQMEIIENLLSKIQGIAKETISCKVEFIKSKKTIEHIHHSK